MVSSSLTLAKSMGDLPGQISTLEVMRWLYMAEGNEVRAGEVENYLGRKEEDLAARMQEAEADRELHMHVMAWRL